VNLKLGNGDSVGNMGGLGAEGAAWVPGVAILGDIQSAALLLRAFVLCGWIGLGLLRFVCFHRSRALFVGGACNVELNLSVDWKNSRV
jgi:hypothetical protein